MRFLTLLSLASALTLTACGDDDTDDGNDELPNDDADNDGLTDAEEAALGLDPENPDTDGDGHLDGAEVEAGTDGTVCWSVPSGWADCASTADGRSEEGWNMGQLTPFFPMTDQNGDEYNSDRFLTMVLAVDLSAGWCGPCRGAAPGMEVLYQDFKDQGFMPIHVMTDDNTPDGNITDPMGFKNEWASQYGLTFPVTTDAGYEYQGNYYNTVYAELSISGVYTGSIPFFAIFDRDHRLVDTQVGSNDATLRALVESYL